MRISRATCSSELRAKWLHIDSISRATDTSTPLLQAMQDAKNCTACVKYTCQIHSNSRSSIKFDTMQNIRCSKNV